MRRKIDTTQLNAYIDGELDRARASDVLTAAAEDPAVARELSSLMRVKSALADAIDTPRISLPGGDLRVPWLQRLGAAAVLVLMLSAAAGLRLSLPAAMDAAEAGWAAAAHRAWIGTPPATGATTPVAAAGSVAFGSATAYIPDLSSARLRIAHIAQRPAGNGLPALIVGYRGTRGCVVTLAIFHTIPAPDDTLHAFSSGGLSGYAWNAGEQGYYVVAEGMGRSRLEGLAQGIRESSLRYRPLSTEMRTALARSRAASPPCRA